MAFHRPLLTALILTLVGLAPTRASLAGDAQGLNLLRRLEGSPIVAIYPPAAHFNVVTGEADNEDRFVAALRTRTGLTDIQMIEEAVPPLR